MKHYGDLDLTESTLANFVLKTETDFPTVPKPGRMLFKNKKLYICAEIDSGLPVWIPLINDISMYVHSQTTPATSWTINHGLGIATVMVQVLDENNQTMIPDYISCTEQNTAYVMFSTPQAGKAIVIAGSTTGTPREPMAFSQAFSDSDTWVVNHGLGYYPEIEVYVNGKMVQPLSIVNNSTTQATVTFSTPQSGFVRCY